MTDFVMRLTGETDTVFKQPFQDVPHWWTCGETDVTTNLSCILELRIPSLVAPFNHLDADSGNFHLNTHIILQDSREIICGMLL